MVRISISIMQVVLLTCKKSSYTTWTAYHHQTTFIFFVIKPTLPFDELWISHSDDLLSILSVCMFNHDQGQLASLHAKRHPPKPPLQPTKLMVSPEFDPSKPTHRSFWSRFAASSLYDGSEYLGCWMKGTFFHQSLRA